MAARVSRASDRSLVIQWLNMARRDAIIVDFHALNIQFAYSFFFFVSFCYRYVCRSKYHKPLVTWFYTVCHLPNQKESESMREQTNKTKYRNQSSRCVCFGQCCFLPHFIFSWIFVFSFFHRFFVGMDRERRHTKVNQHKYKTHASSIPTTN